MNGLSTDTQHNNQRLIIYCVVALGLSCIICGTVLTFKGYNAELLIGGGTAAIAGLLGVLSNRSNTPPPDITVSGQPPKVELTQPQNKPDKQPEPKIETLV